MQRESRRKTHQRRAHVRSAFHCVAPRTKNVHAAAGWLEERRFLTLYGEHQTQNLESRSTIRSDRTVGFFFSRQR